MSTIPPCHGQHELFDSTDPRDHQVARSYCATCPLTDICKQRLEEANSLIYTGVNGGPRGTWAGQLIGARKNAAKPPRKIKPPSKDRSDKLKAAHAAYRRGDRTPEVIKGERAYQQAWREKRRAA